MLRIYRQKFSVYLRIILILCASACQTLKNPGSDEKKADEVLATQKSLVINYLNESQPGMALKELRPLEREHPQDADLKNLMGLVYLSLQNSKEALGYFETAYKMDTRAPIALNLSSALIETGQPMRAIKILKKLQASEAGKSYQYPERIQHNIGLAAERMKKYNLAEKYYKLALIDNPTFYISLMRLGATYELMQKRGFAYQQYMKAHEACLKCFDPVQASVQIQLKAGKTDLALKTLQEYLTNRELEPKDRAKAQQLLGSAHKVNNQIQAQRGGAPRTTSPQ